MPGSLTDRFAAGSTASPPRYNVAMPLDHAAATVSGPTIVRAACPHDCPDTCAMQVTVENGRAIKVEGAPDHPTTRGVLCTKVARYLERTYSSERVLHPLRRVGSKGSGHFERISWDEALDTITARFKAIAASPDGPQAILPYSYAGTMGLLQYCSMDRRFFHRLGASLLDRTICSTAGKAGYTATIGASIGTDLEEFENAKLILIWGSNPIVSNLHLWSRVQEAKRRGAKLIAIDPYRSLTAEKCHVHIAPLPGTDAALALGMMNVLIAEDLLDHDYIARYTLGFDALKERVREYPPEHVARITGLTVPEIVTLARNYGTIRPAVIRLNYGMQRHAGGGMAMRSAACLPALVGAWRDPAGGALLSSSGTYPVNTNALERPDLIWNNPPKINMSTIGDALLDAKDPPIRAIYVTARTPIRRPRIGGHRGFARICSTWCTTCFLTDPPISCCRRRPSSSTRRPFIYGHPTLSRTTSIAPPGGAEHRSFRLLAARWIRDVLSRGDQESPECLCRRSSARAGNRLRRSRRRAGSGQRSPFAPFATRLPTPSASASSIRVAALSGPRSAADLHSATRIGREQPCARAPFPAGDHLASGAARVELDLRQPAGVHRARENALARHPSGRRNPARDQDRRHGPRLQRPRLAHAHGARFR
jgi:hypothetical protein